MKNNKIKSLCSSLFPKLGSVAYGKIESFNSTQAKKLIAPEFIILSVLIVISVLRLILITLAMYHHNPSLVSYDYTASLIVQTVKNDPLIILAYIIMTLFAPYVHLLIYRSLNHYSYELLYEVVCVNLDNFLQRNSSLLQCYKLKFSSSSPSSSWLNIFTLIRSIWSFWTKLIKANYRNANINSSPRACFKNNNNCDHSNVITSFTYFKLITPRVSFLLVIMVNLFELVIVIYYMIISMVAF